MQQEAGLRKPQKVLETSETRSDSSEKLGFDQEIHCLGEESGQTQRTLHCQ